MKSDGRFFLPDVTKAECATSGMSGAAGGQLGAERGAGCSRCARPFFITYLRQPETHHMHLGKSYKLLEFLIRTRRQIYGLLVCGSVPVVVYKFFALTWLSVPLTIVVLLGTVVVYRWLQKRSDIQQGKGDLSELLPEYLCPSETAQALSSTSIATFVLSLQGASLKMLHIAGHLNSSFYMELQRAVGDFIDLQSRSERFKSFPYRGTCW